MRSGSALRSVTAPALVPHRRERVQRALRFLNAQYRVSHGFASYVSGDSDFRERALSPSEIFSTMLILANLSESELALDFQPELLDAVGRAFTPEGFVHFFEDRALLPADVDCTAVALGLMLSQGRALPFDVPAALDRIAANVDERGVVRVYLNADPARARRLDAAVCVNVLHAFSLVGREAELEASADYVELHLSGQQFEEGTRYYPSPDVFLLFISRLIRDFDWAKRRFSELALTRLEQRLGKGPANVLERAARAAAADNLGIVAQRELSELAAAQRADGAWPAAPCFSFGRTSRYFGGESLSTALGVRALMTARHAVQIPALSALPRDNVGRTG